MTAFGQQCIEHEVIHTRRLGSSTSKLVLTSSTPPVLRAFNFYILTLGRMIFLFGHVDKDGRHQYR